MIRILFCLHRLPVLTRQEFHTYWREQHAPLVESFRPVTRLRRYVQHHTLDDSYFSGVAAIRQAPASFDGVAELCWDSIEDLNATATDPAAREAGRALLADEKKFVDLSRSPIFFANAHVIVPG